MAEPLPRITAPLPRTGLAEPLPHIASMAESQGTRARYLFQVTGIGDSVLTDCEIDVEPRDQNK